MNSANEKWPPPPFTCGVSAEKTLVYAAQFLSAEIVVVHGTEHLVLAGIGEMTQRFEEVVVRQLSVVQRGSRCRIPEKTAQRRERQVPAGRR